jgi:hypothetical protein
MKKIYLGILFIGLFSSATGQQWEWGRKATFASASQQPYKIILDNSNNIFVLGSNDGITTYNSFSLNPGSFIVKYNPYGAVQWAKHFSGLAWNTDIACDVMGNLIVSERLDSNNNEIHLIKFDIAGNILWSKYFGGSPSHPYAMALDTVGNIYLCGSFHSDTIFFDSLFLIDTVSNYLSSNYFLTKIDPAGNPQWLIGNPNYAVGNLIATDKYNRVYVAGVLDNSSNGLFFDYYDWNGNILFQYSNTDSYNSYMGLGVIDQNNIFTVTSSGHYMAAPNIKKKDALYNTIWSRAVGSSQAGTNFDKYALDDNGNSYVAGGFGLSWVHMDSVRFQNQWYQVNGSTDLAIAKFDSSSQLSWFKYSGGINGEQIDAITVDKNGNCYVAGTYNISYDGIVDDTLIFNTDTLINDGTWPQMFVAKLNPHMPTSQSEISNPQSAIEIFPNPTTGILNVECKMQNAELKIYNPFGSLIHFQIIKSSNFQIDLTAQPKGVYFLEMEGINNKVVNKLIVH